MKRIVNRFLVAALSLHSVAAFATHGHPRTRFGPRISTLGFAQKLTTSRRRLSRSSLLIASAESVPFVQCLNDKMKRVEVQRNKHEAKLVEYNHQLAQLEQTKQQYLEGAKLGQVEVYFHETALRSATKAMMWRIVAGSITFLTSLQFSQSIAVAFKMVGSDFVSKAATMFIGERLMNQSKAGRSSGTDSAQRSIVKALIWRLFAICNTLAVCLFISKDFSMAYKVAGSDALFKTALMVFFERLWAKIEWGKDYQVDFSI